MKELQVIETQLNESPDKQVSLTDPGARLRMTRSTGIVGYNVQTADDTQHHSIVEHEVTTVGSDRDQLSYMEKRAARLWRQKRFRSLIEVTAKPKRSWLVDAGITTYVPRAMNSGANADGRFCRDALIYDSARNEYICPARKALIWRDTYVENGLTLLRYSNAKWMAKSLTVANRTRWTLG